MPNVITNDVTPPVIRIEGVRKDYTMGDNIVHALRGVDLTAERGEMLAIMGPSGTPRAMSDPPPMGRRGGFHPRIVAASLVLPASSSRSTAHSGPTR